jgi:chemotaxis regulatin CheY-phosphate phosphatase CheZ
MDYHLLSNKLKESIVLATTLSELLLTNQISLCTSPSIIDPLRVPLYRRILLISEAISKLLPVSNAENFSFTSIASLTRVLVESYRPFYYLTIENIKEEERDFRYLLFEVYLLIERRNMIEAIRNGNPHPDLQTELVESKQKIINHPYYKFLRNTKNSEHIYRKLVQSIEDTKKDGPKKNKEFSKGFMDILGKGCFKNDYTILLERLATYEINEPFSDEEKKMMGNRFDKFLNKLMSNYVHSSAFAISMENGSNFQLNDEAEVYLNPMISCCIFYLFTATHDLLKLCQLSQNNDLIQECEKAEEGGLVFLSILTGRCTSVETNP